MSAGGARPVIQLRKALAAWKTPGFGAVLKTEIEDLTPETLPLQQGVSQGSHANREFSVMVISVTEGPDHIRAKTGIFFTSVIAGCSCADDPTPVDEQTEYCELLFEIDRRTAATTVTLLSG